MAKHLFPAVFTPETSGGYFVNFPDIESCYTQGDTLEDAYEMAEDVLCLRLYDIEEASAPMPTPSNPSNISKDDKSFVVIIGADTIEYRRFNDNKAVKKTLTIPQWLNTMAEREGVNFSGILQDALKTRLGITESNNPLP